MPGDSCAHRRRTQVADIDSANHSPGACVAASPAAGATVGGGKNAIGRSESWEPWPIRLLLGRRRRWVHHGTPTLAKAVPAYLRPVARVPVLPVTGLAARLRDDASAPRRSRCALGATSAVPDAGRPVTTSDAHFIDAFSASGHAFDTRRVGHAGGHGRDIRRRGRPLARFRALDGRLRRRRRLGGRLATLVAGSAGQDGHDQGDGDMVHGYEFYRLYSPARLIHQPHLARAPWECCH
jgi:hypothetical protein